MIVDRRQVLRLIGIGGAASLFGRAGTARSLAASCAVTPAETEALNFIDEFLDRPDLRIDPSDGTVQRGVPLRLRINVYRANADCAPAAGVQVDVWHANARGVYSDQAGAGTAGQKFLRGYQISDRDGVVEFTTIYPGWYSGRTVHIHFKLRTFAGSQTTYEFVSQLFFDDAVTDRVLAQPPYDARGARDTNNGADTVYAHGGTGLLLALSDDGNGGYAASFSVGLEGLGSSCNDIPSCIAALMAALPDPALAESRKSRKVARRLLALKNRAAAALAVAASSSGAEQAKLYKKARKALRRLLAKATAANERNKLGVPLAPLNYALGQLLALLPSS